MAAITPRLRETSPKGNKDHTYAVEFDIVCPAGSEIEVTIFASAEEHMGNNPMCTLSIPPQFGLMGDHAKDTTNGHIDLIGAVKGIKVVQNGGFLCAPSETTGELDLDITVSGRNAGGGATPISISEAV